MGSWGKKLPSDRPQKAFYDRKQGSGSFIQRVEEAECLEGMVHICATDAVSRWKKRKKKEYQLQNSMVFSVAILLSIIIIVVGFVVIAIVVVSRYDVLDIVH